jgi:DNA replication initiation complex subunit (GINS family)
MTEEESEQQEIVITYDTLFDILRNEKTKEDLQKLHDTFFKDVVNYLKEKEETLSKENDQQSLFESDDKEKTIHQIGNIKKILKDIYERREKKIMSMALNKSRFSTDLIDTSALLSEEKLFYEMMISLLDSQRDQILRKLLKGELPAGVKQEIELDRESELAEQDEMLKEEFETAISDTGAQSGSEQITKNKESESGGSKSEINQDSKEQNQAEQNVPSKLLRFLAAVPKFLGEDMREYGPYDEEDVAKLPENIAKLLIEKERAEEMKED